MSFSRPYFLRFLLPFVLTLLGAALCAWLLPAEREAVQKQLVGFPDSDVLTHLARPWILTGLCFLPALASFAYLLGGTLDRYIARQFGSTFVLCLATLAIIWFLLDFSDNITEFRDSRHMLRTMLTYYVSRSPAVLLLLLPYSLLLALLYSLGKLSGSREIIAMIQGGRGVVRITLPLIVAGLFFSALSAGLNYHWAPTAEGSADEILSEASGKSAAEATNVLYRNAADGRLWQIGAFPLDYEKGAPLQEVDVTTTRPDKTLDSRLSAKTAAWDLRTQTWTFGDAVLETYRRDAAPIFRSFPAPLVISRWRETPFQLIKPGLSAAELGVPDLTSWIRENLRHGEFADPAPYLTQWHHRWALPLTCMVTVLLATPLAIHFSRRGAGGGVFMAVVLSALMLLVTSISLALGEAGTLRPAPAAWLPNAIFALIGLYLFRRRITGKPIYLVLRKLFPGND